MIAIVASLTLGRPVKWIEDRSREPPGRLVRPRLPRPRRAGPQERRHDDRPARSRRSPTTATRDAAADPSKYPAGLFNVITGSYQMPAGVRGGRRGLHEQAARRRRLPLLVPGDRGGPHDRAARRQGRRRDRHGPGRVPDEELHPQGPVPVHTAPTGWEYDSGDYHAALQKALDQIGYGDLLKEQAEKRARGELMGIGISSFTEIVGAGPSKDFDIIGIKMFDSAELRVHPTGSAILRLGVQSQGQGHETTFAQIVAEELGHPGVQGQGRGGRHGHGAVRPRHVRVALHAGRRRGDRDRRRARSRRRPATSPRTCSSARPTTSSGRPASGTSRAPRPGQDDRGARVRRLHQPSRRGWRPASRRPTTTTRPT